jgi:hypothetical protein
MALAAGALCACGASSDLIDPFAARPDARTTPDASREAGTATCPLPTRLNDAHRAAWSQCAAGAASRSCVTSTDGTVLCACTPSDANAEICGYSLVNFVGSGAVLATARCDSRTGVCDCRIGSETCQCRSATPAGVCGVRTGRNCCWNERF